jgi:hypothetical protein
MVQIAASTQAPTTSPKARGGERRPLAQLNVANASAAPDRERPDRHGRTVGPRHERGTYGPHIVDTTILMS